MRQKSLAVVAAGQRQGPDTVGSDFEDEDRFHMALFSALQHTALLSYVILMVM